jgi:hypothetical protein
MELATKGNAHLLREPDEDGNLPLHIAAANRKFTDDKRERFNSVAYLVSEYPQAAAVRNNKGELPLHLAIRSGKTWEKGVESIYLAYPGAVLERDPAFGLYAFKVAAVVGEGSMESLTTCYHLLKAFPELERFERYSTKNCCDGGVSYTLENVCTCAKRTYNFILKDNEEREEPSTKKKLKLKATANIDLT